MSNFEYLRDVEYAPPDSNFSGLLARSEFLIAIARIEPKAVDDLFLSSWKAFIKATKHTQKITNELMVLAEFIDFNDLVNEDYVTTHEVLPDFSFVRVPLFERQNDFAELHRCLLGWAEKYNLKATWCYDFGKSVLAHFWREMIIREEAEKKTLEKLTTILKEGITKRTSPTSALSRIPPQGDRLTRFLGETLRDIASAHTTSAQEKGAESATAPKTYNPPCKFHLDSWKKVANEILKDAKSALIVPEYRTVNNYDFVGLFLPMKPKPEHLRPHPPDAPHGLPSIAPHEGGRGSYTSKSVYMKNVKVEVESYMHFGIARQLSRNFRKKIVSQIYKEVEPKADRYWEEYAKYLVSQGWRKTTQKRQLKQHCEWLVRGLVCGDKQDVIATSEGKRTTQQAVSVAVNRIAKAIELPLG